MAPSGGRSTRKPRSRRTQQKKKIEEEKANSEDLVAESTNTFSKTSSINIDGDHGGVDDDDVPGSTSGCSTPKGQRFQIPEMLTCPPAPKKPRNLSNCSLLRRRRRSRTPIPFFASPDIELFFFLALRNIPAVL